MSNQRADNIVISASKKVSVKELMLVSSSAHGVTVEHEKHEKHEKQSEEASVYAHSSLSGDASKSFLPVNVCRAIVFSRLVTLLQQKPVVRSEIVDGLANFLNAGVVPCFSSMCNAGNELLGMVTGAADSIVYSSHSTTTTAAAAIAETHLIPVLLFSHEAAVFTAGSWFSTGVACFIGASVKNMLNCVDVVAALSVEASGSVPVDSFDANYYDNHKKQRGQMNSASNLRLLLENSSRLVNPSNSATTPAATTNNSPLVNIPLSTGPATEIIINAVK